MRFSPIEIKTAEQLCAMRRSGRLLAEILAQLSAAARPGVTTAELDELARDGLARAGAESPFLGYDGGIGLPPFPAVICISVNSKVVHGIPGHTPLAEGDLVSLDFGVELNGWYADSAITIGVGSITPAAAALSEHTREAMWAGVAAVRDGGRVGDVSAAIERSVRAVPRRYGIVTDFTGHGIGSALHMEPDVPNRGRPGRGPRLSAGMALAVEPILSAGSPVVVDLDDEWTVETRDRSLAAHWEHTVAITDHGLWVLTAADGGEAELTARGIPFGPLAD